MGRVTPTVIKRTKTPTPNLRSGPGYSQHVDWSLYGCARKGHVTYAPDEPALRERLMAPTAGGAAWRCLRCGAFVTDGQHGSGPAAAAPVVRRGKELRSELILRVFAVERFLRFLVFAVAAYGVWRFKFDQAGIERAYDNDLPAIRDLYRDLGFDVNHSRLLGLIQHSFMLTPAHSDLPGHRAGRLRPDRAGGERRAVAGPAVG